MSDPFPFILVSGCLLFTVYFYASTLLSVLVNTKSNSFWENNILKFVLVDDNKKTQEVSAG